MAHQSLLHFQHPAGHPHSHNGQGLCVQSSEVPEANRVRAVHGQLHAVASESKIRASKQNSTNILSHVPVRCSPGTWTAQDWEEEDALQTQGSTRQPDGLSAEVQEFLTLL